MNNGQNGISFMVEKGRALSHDMSFTIFCGMRGFQFDGNNGSVSTIYMQRFYSFAESLNTLARATVQAATGCTDQDRVRMS